MNIAKHMELIVIVAAVLLCSASALAGDAQRSLLSPVAMQMPSAQLELVPQAAIEVITISARRLSAAEKAAMPI